MKQFSTIYIILFLGLFDLNAQPFDFCFSGQILQETEHPSVFFIEYSFNLANNTGELPHSSESNFTLSDSLGRFTIESSLKEVLFDSLIININSYDHKSIKYCSQQKQWNKFEEESLTTYYLDLEPIKLEIIDIEKNCQIGNYKALNQFEEGNLIHYELLKIGTYNPIYLDKITSELENIGVTFSTIPYFISTNGELQIQHECYLEEMECLLKQKFGENWFKKFSIKI